MSGLIKVTPEQLSAVSAQLNSGAASIEGTLNQLGSQVAPLGSEWAGLGQVRFQEAWNKWHTSQANLHQALAEIAQMMSRASTSYAANDQQVGASFNV